MVSQSESMADTLLMYDWRLLILITKREESPLMQRGLVKLEEAEMPMESLFRVAKLWMHSENEYVL